MSRTTFICVLAVILYVACVAVSNRKSIKSQCNTRLFHEWSKWTNNWPAPNNFGFLEQTRYCTNCGLVQVEEHK